MTSREFIKKEQPVLRPLLMLLVLSLFPLFFHYGNNVTILIIESLFKALIISLPVSLLVYVICLLAFHDAARAVNATAVFLVFFYSYGIVYDYFFELDLFPVNHYTLLPLFALIGMYFAWFISCLQAEKSARLTSNLLFILSALTLFNLAKIIPVEIDKFIQRKEVNASQYEVVAPIKESSTKKSPDIYFIILDEFSGFEPMRKYWKYGEVDEFVNFLKAKGFFVAEKSRSSSDYTLHQISERLNYTEYHCCTDEDRASYYEAISNNRVMSYLKAKGYRTVVFDEISRSFPAKPPIPADVSFRSGDIVGMAARFFGDDFVIMFMDNSMLRIFSNYYAVYDDAKNLHREMVLFTMNNVADVQIDSAPKFTYVHLVFPHAPFLFDKFGGQVSPFYQENWEYYLGQYQFAITVTSNMVNNILEKSDPNNPPVIILQSDHGVRNNKHDFRYITLENYPKEYKTHIMFALLMPEYDFSDLPQDIKPINTFPIVFNHVFGDNIPLK